MSSFTFMGREYPINEFLKDTVEMAGMLAKNARIIDPLPSGVDLSEAEQNATQSQVCEYAAGGVLLSLIWFTFRYRR